MITIVSLMPLFMMAQKQIQIKNQKFEIFAVKDGEPVAKTTRQFAVSLNYETGYFLTSVDMANIRLIPLENPEEQQRETGYYKVEGTFPVNEILYNKNTDQQYKVELNILNRGYTVPVIFNLMVKNYTNARSGFRQFVCSSSIDLRDFVKGDLHGYEPEVKLVVSFEGYIIGQ